MKETDSILAYSSEDIQIQNYFHKSKTTGQESYEQKLIDDPSTGMIVCMKRYPKGLMIYEHTHGCAHGFYVLSGTLVTHDGSYGPGSFVWFKENTPMTHGAGPDKDMDALFITNRAFSINYLENPQK